MYGEAIVPTPVTVVFVPAFILVSEPFAGEPPFVTKKKLKDFPE